ncbi:MAG: hypothetical protein LUE17_18110 [Planctomycetaceae bacterium]|nr:hypothetical protein [Planctomycetaceae bacterium]
MPHPHTAQPSENEVCEKAWLLALADNPALAEANRHLFFYPATATPPPGDAGRYWRETIRGHWIKLAYAALTAPKEEEGDDPVPEEEGSYQIPNPTHYEVGMLAWQLAREHIPSIPQYYREYFLPRRTHPAWVLATDPWRMRIHGFFWSMARERLAYPEQFQTQNQDLRPVEPLPQKRHDRYYPVRTPTMDEVRRKALAMALEGNPWLPPEVRQLFHYPEWVAPPSGGMGIYLQGVVRGHWFIAARNELQREYNAMPRVRMPQRKQSRRLPNRYRFWTRQPLPNGPPPSRRRVFRPAASCRRPAVPPDLTPARAGAPPGRPWEEGTPARFRLPEEDRAPHPFPPGRPGGFNSAEVMLLDNRIERKIAPELC